MIEFPEFKYSKRDVANAGKRLKIDLNLTEETREVFQIAHSWRDSHAYPMRSIKQGISQLMARNKVAGITAVRHKTMPSIRKKLSRTSTKLTQMQDLGGVRAIVETIEDVTKLVDIIKDRSPNIYKSESDYITKPKKISGYRCHHLIYKYNGNNVASVFDNRIVEIQVRTRLQHSWATAVEAIGVIRSEDLKASEGNVDWLRFFELLSAEFAIAENCPEPNWLPSHDNRVKEIKYLNKKLGAIKVLQDFRQAVKALDIYRYKKEGLQFVLLQYNLENATVDVIPKYGRPQEGLEAYSQLELENLSQGCEGRKTVLVEADKVEDLKEAYPNYFGDVGDFIKNLSRVINNRHPIQYAMPKKYVPPKKQEQVLDPRWLRRSPFPRPW